MSKGRDTCHLNQFSLRSRRNHHSRGPFALEHLSAVVQTPLFLLAHGHALNILEEAISQSLVRQAQSRCRFPTRDSSVGTWPPESEAKGTFGHVEKYK